MMKDEYSLTSLKFFVLLNTEIISKFQIALHYT